MSIPSKIVNLVGNNLHTVQDFYAHTNWIEMGRNYVNINVGMTLDLNVPITSNGESSCTPCTKDDMTSGEKAIYETIANNTLLADLIFGKLIPCLGGSIKNVFACHGNIVTNSLTSGYYGDEASFNALAAKPANGVKCSHGGIRARSQLIRNLDFGLIVHESLLISKKFWLPPLRENSEKS